MKIKAELKQVKVYKRFCPKCNHQLSGNGSGQRPYSCKCACGEWKFDLEEKDYVLVLEERNG